MKKIIVLTITLTVLVIASMFMLVGCFLIDTSGYVRRAEKYIAEKYNNLAVEHVMVRGEKRVVTSAQGIITHIGKL